MCPWYPGDIEEEVCLYYENLYAQRPVEHSKEEILECIGRNAKIISCAEKEGLETQISMDDLNHCLKSTPNNISPGASGFTGVF